MEALQIHKKRTKHKGERNILVKRFLQICLVQIHTTKGSKLEFETEGCARTLKVMLFQSKTCFLDAVVPLDCTLISLLVHTCAFKGLQRAWNEF